MTYEVPLTQGMVALVDEADFERVMAAGPWHAVQRHRKQSFFARHGQWRSGKVVFTRMDYFIAAPQEGQRVDHVNDDWLDNCRANLRCYTPSRLGKAIASAPPKRIATDLSHPCHLWGGPFTPNGYGITRREGRQALVHRVAWEEAYGPIPDGLFVCHRCDVKHCVEPTHLFLGTNSDNIRDAYAKGLMIGHRWPPRPGASNPSAKLTAEQVAEIRATVRPLGPGRGKGGLSAAGRHFGVSDTTIKRILKGETWR